MTSAELRGCGFGGVSGQEGLAVDPAAATELPLPSRGVGSTCSSRRRRVGTASRWVGWRAVGDRGRPCAPRTAMSSRSLRSAPSGLEENAVADRKVRSRRRRPDRIGRAQRLRGRGRAGLRGRGRAGLRGQGEWVAGRQRAGAGCAGRELTGTPQSMGRTEGLRSRSGHGWGSMRDCGGNRKEPGRIGVESLTSAVYASALRALCVLVRGVSALRAGPGPSEPWRA